LVLYDHSEKRLVEKFKLDAALHGVKFNENKSQSKKVEPPKTQKGVSGDPDSYSHLSMEERDRITKTMMEKHKFWVENDRPLGGKAPIDKR